MLKWIGGMQAFLLVVGLVVATVILVVTNTDSIITFIVAVITNLVFCAYSLVMAIWVMPAIRKEKKEKRQAVLDKGKDTISMYIASLDVIYKTLINDLSEKGFTPEECEILFDEIRTSTGDMEKANAK